MAKVKFIRKETKEQINNLDIVDGQFIVCKDGSAYVDYGNERKGLGGTPDTSVSDTSTNSVQNKVIKEYVDTKTQEAKEYTDEKLIYSTDEKVVGTWIDGKPIYRKTYDVGNLPNTSAKDINYNINNLKRVISIKGNATDGINYIPIPNVHSTSLAAQVAVYLTSTTIKLTTGSDRTGYTGYLTIEYTKTTD